MKRIIFLLFILMSSHTHAQVHIYDNGRTVVGNTNTSSPIFSIGDDTGITTSKAFINNSTKNIGLCVNSTAQTGITYGMRIHNYQNNTGSSYGIMITPNGSSNKTSIGVKSSAGNTTDKAYGVYGGLEGTVTKGTGIFGSATSSSLLTPSGVYAGYFKGDVYTTGNIYGTVLTRSLSNGQSDVVSASALDLERSRVTDRICGLDVVLAFVNEGITVSDFTKMGSVMSDSSATDTFVLDEQIEENRDDITLVNSMSTGLRYVLDCEALKEAFPELVYEDSEGNTSINYIEMIPLLVQSIKELNEEIAILKTQLEASDADTETRNDAKTNSRDKATTIDALGQSDTNTAVLGQNIPNPFSETTTIDITVPLTVKNAHIFIYDMSGKEIKRMAIAARGKTSVSIAGEDLTSGMYLYSLIADGKVVSTKRMILAK